MMTKLQRLKDMMEAGDEFGALRMAARFPRLGAEKETITRGWAAVQNPEFYVSLGLDPDELFRAAVQAIRDRYGI